MRKYILSNVILIVLLVSMLSGCLGGTVTETVTETQTQTILQTTIITTSSIREELSTSEIVKKVNPTVAHILGEYGAGTGIVVDSRGYILTNNHVVEDEDNVAVRIPDREEVTAEIVYRDSSLDIAIIKCPGTGYPYTPLGSMGEPSLGDDVIVIGYPLSALLGESASMSKGIISAFRTIEGVEYIQTDAPVNPGNSGGPLINNYGEVIGVVCWGIAETEGMNFAIELNIIKTYIEDIIQQLIEGGISITTVTQIKTITQTVSGGTVTKTVTETVSKFVCPVCGEEFDSLAALQAHFEAEHGDGTPSPTTTVTVTATKTVTETPTTTPPPTTTTPTDNIVFTFTGVGRRSTPPFSIDTSPWIFRCSTSWSGTFLAGLYSESSGFMSITLGGNLIEGQVYETYVYNKTGNNLYFNISDAPTDGEWTITVIEVS